MQQPWARSTKECIRHAIACSVGLSVFAMEAVYGSVINSLASHVISSQFVLGILTALEYTVAVCGALFVALTLVADVLRKLKRVIR